MRPLARWGRSSGKQATLFQSDNIDPAAIQEAGRLAKSAAGIWFGGWVVTFLLASLLGSGAW